MTTRAFSCLLLWFMLLTDRWDATAAFTLQNDSAGGRTVIFDQRGRGVIPSVQSNKNSPTGLSSHHCVEDDRVSTHEATSVPQRRTVRSGRLVRWDRLLDPTKGVTTITKTMESKGKLTKTQPTGILVSSPLGMVGKNTGLMLLSILLVKAVYTVFFPKDKSEEEPAGILDRCPWPFIIFHDPKQFLKDSPTWMIVTWITLRRILKASKSVVV